MQPLRPGTGHEAGTLLPVARCRRRSAGYGVAPSCEVRQKTILHDQRAPLRNAANFGQSFVTAREHRSSRTDPPRPIPQHRLCTSISTPPRPHETTKGEPAAVTLPALNTHHNGLASRPRANVTPHATGALLPALRNVRATALIVRHAAGRMLREVLKPADTVSDRLDVLTP